MWDSDVEDEILANVGIPLPRSVALANSNITHAHPRDARIRLDEARHVYVHTDSNGQQQEFSISVSGVWARYFAPFNARAIVDTYFDRWASDGGSNYHACIIASRAQRRSDEDIKQDIIKRWADNGAKASGDGTYMHRQIELALGCMTYDGRPPEMKHFIQWVWDFAEVHRWQVFRTEWSIFSEETCIAGQIDAIFRDAIGNFHMVDWKRCKEALRPDAKIQFGRFGKPPLVDLVDNAYSHYVVQQNLYCTILQTEYNFSLQSMKLIRCHPDAESYQIVCVPFLDQGMLCNIMQENRGTFSYVCGAAAPQRHLGGC